MTTEAILIEKIEAAAKSRLDEKITLLHNEIREVMMRHEISKNVQLYMLTNDGTKTYPFLASVVAGTAVREAIYFHHWDSEVKQIINEMMYNNEK